MYVLVAIARRFGLVDYLRRRGEVDFRAYPLQVFCIKEVEYTTFLTLLKCLNAVLRV
jgi:hypothetical protein